MRVFLSAARSARQYVDARLIGGYEVDLPGDTLEFNVGEDPEGAVITLTARPTGKYYRQLPWWEVTYDGSPWVLTSREQERAFAADWALGTPLAEMAALHGFRNVNSVTRAAKRLGLPKRPGGPEPRALGPGRWVRRGLIQIWEEA
jgi:hypothetical protein